MNNPQQDPERLVQNLEGDKACSFFASCFVFWLKLKLFMFGYKCYKCGKKYDPAMGSLFCSNKCRKDHYDQMQRTTTIKYENHKKKLQIL